MAAPILDLQPRTGGDIIDAAVTLYRRHFATVLILAAIPVPLYFVMTIWMEAIGEDLQARRSLAAFGSWAMATAGYSWVYFLMEGALYRWTSETSLGGKPGILGSYLPILRRGFSVVFLLAIYALALAGPLVPVGFFLASAISGIGNVTGVILIAILILGPVAFGVFLLLIRFTVALVVIAAENVKCSRALARSWRIVRGNTWRGAAITLFAMALNIAPAAIIHAAGYLMDPALGEAVSGISKNLVLQVVSALLTPIGAIASTLFYFDCRIRQEALDLDLLARSLGPPAEITLSPTSHAAERAEASTADLPSPSELLHDPAAASGGVCARCGLPTPPGRLTCQACAAPAPPAGPDAVP